MKTMLFILLICSVSFSKTLKVAVIDTGFDFKSTWQNYKKSRPKLCKTGHWDFTAILNHKDAQDKHGHGTHIASLIAQYAENSNYCIEVYKYYSIGSDGLDSSIAAINRAILRKVDIINMSFGGFDFDARECAAVKKALNNGIIVVAALGNNNVDVSIPSNAYYPALCDPRIIKVGNYKKEKKQKMSNYVFLNAELNLFKNIVKENGDDVMGLGLDNTIVSMTGTSQATAITTGKLVYKLAD